MRAGVAQLGAVALLAACSGTGAVRQSGGAPLPRPLPTVFPRTVAERTGFRETSRYAAVQAFLDSLQLLGAPIWVGEIGKTTEGRALPLVILSRPLVTTPAQARRLGRPVIYLQANIHAGEVEGKEAVQALVRDLALAPGPNSLDSVVLLAVPIYNADGNERVAAQSRNRSSQNGPEMVGERANAQGLDLNRDYIKAEAPETRASLRALNEWDPDIFVDLHTTNGSYHGYALTYSPSLNPAAFFGGSYTRDSLLPVLRSRMRERRGFETFDYGNFDSQDSVQNGWKTYDSRPRFGTNYLGLRGRIAILSEAYSHDPFEKRVRATYAFVSEILSLAAERANQIRTLSRIADSSVTAWGMRAGSAPKIPLSSELTSNPVIAEVLVEDVERTGDSSLTEPGVPRGVHRTGRTRAVRMPVHDRFVPGLERSLPYGYSLAAADEAAVRKLQLHGVMVERLSQEWTAAIETFVVDSIIIAERLFQGHFEVRLAGRWNRGNRLLPAGSYLISTAQPLGFVAFYLLEPESDDGLTTWNTFDARLSRGGEFPVLRIVSPVSGARRVQSP
ncbi:MAG: M14 family metallopeptidase [Gemmatimonadaceae bacterium]